MLGQPSRRTRKRLKEHGRRAPATIVEIAEKGMTMTSGNENVVSNTEFILATKLQVKPPDEPEFAWSGKLRFMQLSVPPAGSTLAVIFDPEDHEKLMLDDEPDAQAGATLGGLDAGLMQQIQQAQQAAAAMGTQPPIAGTPGGFGAPPAAPASTAAPDAVGQLERLAALKEKGLLSDAEFETEKAKILEG